MTQQSPHPPPKRPTPRRSPAARSTPNTSPAIIPLAAPSMAVEALQPPAPTADPARTLRAALGALGLLLSATPQHAFPWRVLPGLGSAFTGHRFELASLVDGQAMPTELPAHLAAPPPWMAALTRFAQGGHPMPDLIAWTAGYSGARRQFFASRGAFIPLHVARAKDVPCPYPPGLDGETTADGRAFVAGAAAYLRAVRLGAQDRQLAQNHPPDLSRPLSSTRNSP